MSAHAIVSFHVTDGLQLPDGPTIVVSYGFDGEGTPNEALVVDVQTNLRGGTGDAVEQLRRAGEVLHYFAHLMLFPNGDVIDLSAPLPPVGDCDDPMRGKG